MLRGLIVTAAIAATVVLGMRPMESTTVPEWRIQFTDMKGSALKGLPVRQSWRNYTVETEDHVATAVTDGSGFVTFPERTLTVSPFGLVVGVVKALDRASIHGGISLGRSSSVLALCNLRETQDRLLMYYGTDLPTSATMEYVPRSPSPEECDPLIRQAVEAATPGRPEPPSGQSRPLN